MSELSSKPRNGGPDSPPTIRCPECRETWNTSALTKTGSVLRCPACDGVVFP